MHTIHTKIVLDEAKHPVAVLIDYQDWLEIEKQLALTNKKIQLSSFEKSIQLTEDPLIFQSKIRSEWDR